MTLAAGGAALAHDARSRRVTLLVGLGLAATVACYALAGPYAGGR